VSFYESLFEKFHQLPKSWALARVKEAATLEDEDPALAAKQYLAAREAWIAKDPTRKAVEALEGATAHTREAPLVEQVLQSGGKVYVALEGDRLVFHTAEMKHLAPVAHKSRRSFVYSFKGQDLQIPLSQFVKEKFPKSKAAGILANPGRSSKSVVGPWEAINRDPQLKGMFSRRPKQSQGEAKAAA